MECNAIQRNKIRWGNMNTKLNAFAWTQWMKSNSMKLHEMSWHVIKVLEIPWYGMIWKYINLTDTISNNMASLNESMHVLSWHENQIEWCNDMRLKPSWMIGICTWHTLARHVMHELINEWMNDVKWHEMKSHEVKLTGMRSHAMTGT